MLRRLMKNTICLLCCANLILISSAVRADESAPQEDAKVDAQTTSREQLLREAEKLGMRVMVTMSDGTKKSLQELLLSGQRFEDVIFHIPEMNLHLRMRAKPAKDRIIVMFRMLDADGQDTDRMTQVKIDPSADQTTLFTHLKDSLRVLSATADTTKNLTKTDRTRLPASACGAYQTRDEQLRNLIFHVSLVGTGALLAGIATGNDFAILKLPVFLLGSGLALYGLRLIHTDFLPPCPLN